jgi:hypothetical protein
LSRCLENSSLLVFNIFANVTKDGNQASRVLDLANASVEELSALSEQELGMTADSAMNKFKKSVEDLKFALIPVGQAFLEAATPIVEFVGGVLEKFGNLSDGTKKLITVLTVGIGAIGPIFLMTFGLVMNALANTAKLFLTLRQGYLRLTGQSQILGEQTQYLNTEQMEAAAAAHSLDQSHAKLTQSFTSETAALQQLIAAYQSATRAGNAFMLNNPGMMMPGRGGRKLASGIVSVPGPKGAGDIVPAMLSPGEAVIPSDMAKKYAPLIQGMIANNIPGYQNGLTGISFNNKNFNIPAGSGIDLVIAKFNKDIEGVTRVLDNLEKQALEMGESFRKISADRLKDMLDENQVQRNRPKGTASSGGYVFAHAMDKTETISDPKRLQEISNMSVSKQIQRMTASSANTPGGYANVLSNYGFVLPEGANKGRMSPQNVAKEFTGANIPRTMAPIYEEYARNLGMSLDQALNSPEIASMMHQDINQFANTLSENISKIPSQFLQDPDFYMAVEQAEQQLSGVMSNILTNSINNLKQPGALATFGGDVNRGTLGQRPSIPLKDVALRENLGTPQGIKSFRDTGTKAYVQKGNQISNSLLLGVEQGAQTQSPSKKTIKVGEDIARGLEVGMANRQDDVALVGSQLGGAAAGGVKGGVGNIPFRAPGQPGFVAANIPKTPALDLSDLTANARMNKEKLLQLQQAKQSKVLEETNRRFSGFNNKIMGGTFALTSLAGIASMAGGSLGKLSGIVFQLSGVMFALSTVLNILPTKLRAFLLLPGPALAFTAALVAGVGIIKLVNNAREKERLATEGLADAMTMASEKVKTLAGLLGQTPTARAGSGASISAAQLNTTQRTKVEELRGNKEFLSTYKNDIESIKNATTQEAISAFQAIALDLGGQGFEKEAIDAYINALALEAEKTDVIVKFKAINLDLSTEEGKLAAEKLAKESISSFNKAFESGIKTTRRVVGGGKGGVVLGPEINVLTSKQQKTLKETTAKLGAVLTSTTSGFAKGSIKAEEYNARIATLFKELPKGNAGLLGLNQLLENVNPTFAEASTKIKDHVIKQKLLKASLLDLAVAQEIFNDLISGVPYRVEGATKRLDALTNATEKTRESLFGPITDAFKNLEDDSKEKSPFQKAKEDLIAQRKELENTRKSYSRLKSAGVETGRAFEIAKDPILAAALATTKVGSSKWKELLKLIKQVNVEGKKTPLSPEEMFDVVEKSIEAKYRNAIKNGEAAIETSQKTVDGIEKEISAIQDSIEKKQRNIELTLSRPIEALQSESSLLSEQLKDIDRAAEGINKKYDEQEKALTKISEINQEIAEQEKGRLGLADALSRGDIAAAASAAQQLRADAAKNAMGRSSGALQAAREAEIAGLRSATGLTKDQIAARQLEIEKQIFALEQQKTTATLAIRLEEDEIYNIQKGKLLTAQNALVAARESLQKTIDLKDADLEVINQQKQYWEDKETADNLANVRAGEYKKQIKETQDKAQGVLDRILALNRTVITTHIIETINTSGPAPKRYDPLTGTYNMYGGKIKPMNMGGVVPKYFGNGGRMGSDTVPAMLTPGEFVMNRQATKSFGPLLEMLNESKYPSMIGSSYDGQGSGIGAVTSVNDNSRSVYNYNVGINVPQSNANPNDIARAVIGQIKYIDNQRIRGQR